MKIKLVLSTIIVAFLCIGTAISQIVPHIKKVSLVESDKKVLDQRINKYTTFTMDRKELKENLYSNGGKGQFRVKIDENLDWTLDLEFNDMRSPEFKQTYTTDKGEFEWNEPFIVNTFKGKTSDGKIARFTIDENNFFGVIFDDNDHYVIRAVNDFTKDAKTSSNETLVAYKYSDLIPDRNDNDFDYINDALEVPEKSEPSNDVTNKNTNKLLSSLSCMYYLRIATDADYEFYQACGSNLINTYSYIFSTLNIASGVYEKTFKMVFVVTFQNVMTTNTIYTVTNDYGALLEQIRSYWNSNRAGVARNIAHIFSGKSDFALGASGAAWRGNIDPTYTRISASRAYGFTIYQPLGAIRETYQIVAHEIGHNLNAVDNPSANDCNCGLPTPYPPSASIASVMCQGHKARNLYFCSQSKTEITNFINNQCYNNNVLSCQSNKAILQSYGYYTTLILYIPLTGFNLKQATQTITSTQAINSGYTIYKAGKTITLLAF